MPRRILIVDDEPNIVASLEFLMRGDDYEVRVARDGEEALVLAAGFHPDLVLLDAMMPQRSGFEVCRKIREDPALRNVKIVMLTAKGREIDQKLGREVGANDYITKPFSPNKLIERVQAILGVRR